jgi:anti-sigma factor RsiW
MNARIEDTDLHAWLDGELPPERHAEVQAWLHEHPEDAARVRLWAADREALRARLDPVLTEPVPQRLEQVVWSHAPAAIGAPWQRWAAAVAVFALGGAIGAALTWRLQPTATVATVSAPTAWVQRAAVAHSVYVPEVRHPVEVDVAGKNADESRAQEEHLSRWLTKRLDVPVKLFDLRAQGFALVGGRLLPDAAGPSAQLMYQALGDAAPGGTPARVTVYLRKPDDATPVAFRYEQKGDLGMFYWVEGRSATGGPCGYALVGALPRAKLLTLAEAIYAQ